MNLMNILTATITGPKDESTSILEYRQIVIATVYGIIGMFTAFIMAIFSYLQADWFILKVDAGIALFLFGFLWNIKKRNNIKNTLKLGSLVMGAFLVYLIYEKGFDSNVHLWFYVYPMIAISTTGSKRGTKHFLFYLSFLILLSMAKVITGITELEPIFFIRYLLSTTTVFILSSYMEKTSEEEHRALIKSNKALEETHKSLQELTIRDTLTGLFNRRYLDDMLPLALNQSRRYSAEVTVLMIDVDYFKKYNDHYGHPKGDDVLCEVAAVLEKYTRRETDYVCRYGGEEFIIIMNKSSHNAVDSCAEDIISGFEELNIAHKFGIDKRLTVSMGIATSDQNIKDTQQSLIERADSALYEAKKLGRNRYIRL